jgi:hypothetical protein
MDEQVVKALAKWPNVPHCYGWLALDARGDWRMRDERAQAAGASGERITSNALTGFINRNYTHDDTGRWYFQNGPQRVYVELQAAPYIAHLEGDMRTFLHTGAPMQVCGAWLSNVGNLWLSGDSVVAMLDGRDLGLCLPLLTLDGKAIDENALQAWMERTAASGPLVLNWDGKQIAVDHLVEDEAPDRFGFVRSPRAKR